MTWRDKEEKEENSKMDELTQSRTVRINYQLYPTRHTHIPYGDTHRYLEAHPRAYR